MSNGTDEWGNGLADDGSGFAPEEGQQDYDFDAGEANPDKVGGRMEVDKVGKYHFEVTAVIPKLETTNDRGNEVSPKVTMQLTVLKSADGQSPAGSITYHDLIVGGRGGGPPKQACVDGVVDFLYAAGMLRKVQTPDGVKYWHPKEDTTKLGPIVAFCQKAKGEQLIGRVVLDKAEPGTDFRDRIQLPFSGGAYRLDDPAVADVPRDSEAAEMWNPPAGKAKANNGTGNGEAAAKPAEKPQAAPTKPAAPAKTAEKPAPEPEPVAAAAAVDVDDDF